MVFDLTKYSICCKPRSEVSSMSWCCFCANGDHLEGRKSWKVEKLHKTPNLKFYFNTNTTPTLNLAQIQDALTTMADQPKKSKSASAGDRLSWVIAMIKHSDITSVDWTKICEEVNCNSESTMQNRWKALRNEFLPGFTLKTMKAEDVGNAKPKPKSKAGKYCVNALETFTVSRQNNP